MADRSRRNRRATCTSMRCRPAISRRWACASLRGRDFAIADTAGERPGRHRQRVAGAQVLPERESDRTADQHRPERAPPEPGDRRPRAGYQVPDAAGTGAPDRVSPGRAAWRRTEPVRGSAARRPAAVDRRARRQRGARAGRRRAGQDRNRQRPHPRIARQRAGHGRAGIGPWLHRARPGLRGALRAARLRGLATGEGDRLAARARRHACGACSGSCCATA